MPVYTECGLGLGRKVLRNSFSGEKEEAFAKKAELTKGEERKNIIYVRLDTFGGGEGTPSRREENKPAVRRKKE